MDFATTRGPLLLAHRGTPLTHVENTLPALANALACGADVLELDVRMSADGHVVVAHDETGARLAGTDRAIASASLAELRTWRLQDSAHAAASASLATLCDVLEAFPTARLNVDIKQDRPDMVPTLLDLLARHAAQARVLLTSFSARNLWRVRRRGYTGPLGLSQLDAVRVVLGPRSLARWLGPFGQRLQIPTRFGALDLGTRPVIERAHALGLRVDYWVVNDLAEAERLLDLGADGLVTDDCRSVAELFARHVRTAGFRERHARTSAAR
ncbi:MAG TPA: glycerophosphodiester phosphodiesterase family protein [Polyangiales bacterium]